MNRSSLWLAFAAAWFTVPAAAAPVPVPPTASGSPVADALRLLDMQTRGSPLLVRTAVMGKEGVVELERPGLVPQRVRQTRLEAVPVQKFVTENVPTPDGKVVQVQRVVTATEYRQVQYEIMVLVPGGKPETVPVPVKSCKFFAVTKDGKLEPLDAAKATTSLKTKIAILTGERAEVDPRHLELIKPGTLYLVLPPPLPPIPPIPPREREGT